MQKRMRIVVLFVMLVGMLVVSASPVASQVGPDALKNCKELAFSTEEDFVTNGLEPSDGNPIISDGDLLGIIHSASGAPTCAVCARNADLVGRFDVGVDLGLDAVDVINVDTYLVAFSTELDSPNQGQFYAGDLLVTNGAIIPNVALTHLWQLSYDIGLDGVHFVGDIEAIEAFLGAAAQISREGWLEAPSRLSSMLKEAGIDLWFSTEGTLGPVDKPLFLDGDLLSAGTGTIVAGNDVLLPPAVPAGIPVRGVDFGLDAVTSDRSSERQEIHFSTEILYDGELSFTDGDVLQMGNGVVARNYELLQCFQPRAKELGLDALSVYVPPTPPCISRITDIGGVDVGDIDPSHGMVYPLTLAMIDAPLPFGGQIDFKGDICDDVDAFRVVYRKAGSADPWESMKVLATKNWRVKVDAFIPAWPDCLGKVNWASDGNGWYDGSDYRHLSEAALGGCNPDLSLTVWESASAVAGKDELYEVVLETQTAMGVVSDTMRLVQLDNTWPTVELEKTWGDCKLYSDKDMPLTVTARISDTHFYEYQLQLTGDSYGWENYTPVAFYDDPTDNVIATGTDNWDLFVPLHDVNVFDLVTSPEEPVKCGYTVMLTAWDRTVSCGFTYPSNWISRCVGCRHTADAWSFDYDPALP